MNTNNPNDAGTRGAAEAGEAAGREAAGLFVDIRHISAAQLAMLGLGGLAYVKRVATENGTAYAIHAADGSPMALVAAQEVAVAAIIQHEMVPALVH